MVARAAPASTRVVKAFNTLFRDVLAAGGPLDVFVAGDDTQAKEGVSAFIHEPGTSTARRRRPEHCALAGGGEPAGDGPGPQRPGGIQLLSASTRSAENGTAIGPRLGGMGILGDKKSGSDGPRERRRSLHRFLATAAAGLVLAAVLAVPIAGAAPVGGVEHFPAKCGVGTLVAGPDGNVWFTCSRKRRTRGGSGRSLIGRITPAGQVSEFAVPAHLGIGGIVAGPDGNLWVLLSGAAYPPSKSRPSAIGRMTPGGEMTLFKVGLRKGSNPGEIVAGADGNLWFGDIASGQARPRSGGSPHRGRSPSSRPG